MIVPTDKNEFEVSVLARPTGLMILLATAPRIDAFETIRTSEPRPDLWIQWVEPRQADGAATRMAFVTRQGPYTSATKGEVIAYSARLDCFNRSAAELAAIHKLLGAQKIVDLLVGEIPIPKDGDYRNAECVNGIYLLAFIERPNYPWKRYQALCQQLALEMRDRRRRRPPDRTHQGDGRVSIAAKLPLRRP